MSKQARGNKDMSNTKSQISNGASFAPASLSVLAVSINLSVFVRKLQMTSVTDRCSLHMNMCCHIPQEASPMNMEAFQGPNTETGHQSYREAHQNLKMTSNQRIPHPYYHLPQHTHLVVCSLMINGLVQPITLT